MKLNRIMLAVIAGAVIFSASGCYFLPEEEELLEAPVVRENEVSYTTTAATKRDLTKQILTPGAIASGTEYNARFQDVGGNIKAVYVHAGDTVEEGQLLAEFETYELDSNIARKEKELYREQLEYDIAVEKHESENVKAKELLDVELMQNDLDKLYDEKEAAKLYSGVSGTVSYVLTCSPGDWVNPGVTVVKVIDVTDLYIKIDPDEKEEFMVGRPIKIRYDGEYFDGTIVGNTTGEQWDEASGGPLKDENGDDILTAPTDAVTVRFNDMIPESSSVGNIADTLLILDERKDVIVISANLVKTVDGVKCVYVFKDNQRTQVNVTLGLQSGSLVEITSGLEEGDEVIIR